MSNVFFRSKTNMTADRLRWGELINKDDTCSVKWEQIYKSAFPVTRKSCMQYCMNFKPFLLHTFE